MDFTQAYDKVPRDKLFYILKRLGCGSVMLLAVVAMYKVTECMVGMAIVTASVGVRQGCSTSCLLFVIFVNDLITLIKNNCCADGFLVWLHVLVLMSDTVLLSTSRAAMLSKVRILKDFCDTHDMEVNLKKTKFFVINGNDEDRQPLDAGGLVVEYAASSTCIWAAPSQPTAPSPQPLRYMHRTKCVIPLSLCRLLTKIMI